MIGMMNGGTGDVPLEFYGGRSNLVHGAPSVYSKPKLSQTLSYTQDGRILINGQPMVYETPEEQWQRLVLHMRTRIVCEKHLEGRKTRKFKKFFSPQTSLRSLRGVLSRSSSIRSSRNHSAFKGKPNHSGDKVSEEKDEEVDEKKSNNLSKLFTSIFISSNNNRRRKNGPVKKCTQEVILPGHPAQLAMECSEVVEAHLTCTSLSICPAFTPSSITNSSRKAGKSEQRRRLPRPEPEDNSKYREESQNFESKSDSQNKRED